MSNPALTPQEEEELFEIFNELDNADEHLSLHQFQRLENLVKKKTTFFSIYIFLPYFERLKSNQKIGLQK